MPVTLLALYRRPEGGDEAFDTFHERYLREHLPLISKVPGLRSTTVHRVDRVYTGTDLVLVTEMTFDDQAALDTAMASEEMRVAGRNLRDIGPGPMTLLAMSPDPDHQAGT